MYECYKLTVEQTPNGIDPYSIFAPPVKVTVAPTKETCDASTQTTFYGFIKGTKGPGRPHGTTKEAMEKRRGFY